MSPDRPSWWFVVGLPWRESDDEMSEAALAVAPETIPRDRMPQQLSRMLFILNKYRTATAGDDRVVWLSDVTLWLSARGMTWSNFEIDWQQAVTELRDVPILGLYLTINKVAHFVLCSSAVDTTVIVEGPNVRESDTLIDDVRASMEEALIRDWAPYVQRVMP